ncbi:Alkaline phosphatase synthesis sensor protein phoR [uncultured Clostridium sp.]|nr:Alkaline phosphatase synthesis sensor protein phoR [uncultured Clostridium sp.]SCI93628.1 Alkaline phosphatase synthesis sensor protein phoR [uncultured Clostridium sp.]
MKNKLSYNSRIYKYMFQPIFDLLISCILSGVLLYTLRAIVDKLYRTSRYDLINYIVDYFMYLKHNSPGELVYTVLFIVVTTSIYILITYKKSKNIVSLIESVEIMANGNLEHVIDVNDSGNIKRLADNINNIVSQLRNITIEERMAQQTKTDLITNVSHDLRTPLTSIIGYLSLIEDDKYKDEVQLRYYTSIAYEKSNTLKILIDDLFDLTKMQNNTMKLNKVKINLVELIGQIVSHFEYQFKEAHMEGRLNFSEDRCIIEADPIKLVRAFENLITNAMKYGKDGYYIDIVTEKKGEMAIVKVINYGEPIPVLDLPHIFDRFYRVEKSRNRNDGGSGLGLAITKNIIEIHDGEISVTSDNNETVFEVKIPLINDELKLGNEQ